MFVGAFSRYFHIGLCCGGIYLDTVVWEKERRRKGGMKERRNGGEEERRGGTEKRGKEGRRKGRITIEGDTVDVV